MNMFIKIIILFILLVGNNLNAKSVNDELRVTLQKSKITLDPGRIRDSQSLFISRQIDCELIRTQGSAYILEAAKSINYITPLKIRIKLNDNIKFHDGSQIKAEDVLASYDYINKSKNVFNNFFTWIDKIHVVNDTTIELVLKKETPQLLKVLSSSSYPIFKKEFLEKAKVDKRLWENPLSCGRYKISEFNNKEIQLTPISNGLPIRFYLINENQIDSKDLGKYDIITLNILGKSEQINDFNLVELFSPKQFYIGLNPASNLWKDKYERCAFLSKLNISEEMLKKYGNNTIIANDLIPKSTFGYSKEVNFNDQLKKLAQNAQDIKFQLNGRSLCLAYLTVSVQEKQKKLYLDLFKDIYPNISMKPILNVKQFGKQFVDEHCDVIIFGLVSSYYDGYEFLTVFEDNDANFTGGGDKKLFHQIMNSQYISNPLNRANEYRNIINKIAKLCVVKPIYTSLIKKVYIRKTLKAPGIGLTVLHQYFLGNISRENNE